VGLTITERIAGTFCEEGRALSGDYVTIRPAHVLTHDNTAAVIPKFRSIALQVSDARQPVIVLDHDIQNVSVENISKYSAIEAFAREQGIDFYPAGRGIGHQVMVEDGYAWPGTMVVASDSHANMYGGIGCLGTPVTRTDAAALWATGSTWWQVPPVAKVVLNGRLPRGACGKDIIIALCGLFPDEILNHTVEFTGSGVSALSIDERLAIANMTTEWGGLAGIFPGDEVTTAWLLGRAQRLSAGGTHPRVTAERIAALRPVCADADARYAIELELDLSSVQPHVAGPNSVQAITSVAELAGKRISIQKAYLVSCVNSRLSDLREAAEALSGRKVAQGVELYLSAASSEVQQDAESAGYWKILLDAGAKPLPPGCGPCIGLGAGLLKAGEVGISSTNRNFRGRMGSPDSQCYLASPAVVAHSAALGWIAVPQATAGTPLGRVISRNLIPAAAVEMIPGFPLRVSGEVLLLPADRVNTDAIYPGKYTYRSLSSEEQAAVAMENYDPQFARKARRGDILVSGRQFGMGSSREQAATCLKHAGICAVVAASLNETYARNALNNGLLVMESPELFRALRERWPDGPTVRTGIQAELDFCEGVVRALGTRFPMNPLGRVGQELLLAGGLEEWVRRRMPREASRGQPLRS